MIVFLTVSCSPAPVTHPDPSPPPTQQQTPVPVVSPTPNIDEKLRELAETFRSLRTIPGQFSGGEWRDEVDQWQGRKHQIMIELGSELGNGRYSQEQIVSLLGPPDFIVKGGNPLFNQITTIQAYEEANDDDEFLIYEWRGTHDFLFFAIQDGRPIQADWWYSGE